VAAVRSPELSAIVGWMLRESNNVIAEDLARQIALRTGRPVSFSGGAAAVTAVLRTLGAGRGIHLVDGSGLSPLDRVTPDALAAVVRLAARGPATLRAAVTGMPVAGFSGTLARGQSVFGSFGPPALGVVRAKTGNLNRVASLSGIVDDASGQVLAFAFMADRIPKASMLPAAAGAIDAMATKLAGCGCR
jgi:D-alanyl-D-alanine carboxypeptidase/D-alanyl-D-alanine-endopeptidase (penicillin-binding protein 4)